MNFTSFGEETYYVERQEASASQHSDAVYSRLISKIPFYRKFILAKLRFQNLSAKDMINL
jgi:hypothetical protein